MESRNGNAYGDVQTEFPKVYLEVVLYRIQAYNCIMFPKQYNDLI